MTIAAGPISLCALFYGDYPHLAHRCLSSIWERMSEGHAHLQDVRLAMNQISDDTRRIVSWFRDETLRCYKVPVITYDMPVNACKYPVMRRMLLDDPREPAEWVMWFDDDSYLNGESGWWSRLLQQAESADMLGQPWYLRIQGQQWDWITKQKWFNPAVGRPPRSRYKFCTGGWWMIRSAVLKSNDWPSLELRHRGGDSMLGELIRHRQLRMVKFDEGVRINADEQGRHSKSARRGVDEAELGKRPGSGDLSHQTFAMTRILFNPDDAAVQEISIT